MAQDSFRKSKRKKTAQDAFKKKKRKRNIAQDFIKYLPSEIVNEILLRLPVRTIATCKRVCKSWLDFLETDEFVKFHHSRSSESCLAVLMNEDNSSRCTVYELEDDIDAESSHESHYSHLTTFDFPRGVEVLGSANGLLLLVDDDDSLYVWNPISREYIELNCPQGFLKQPTNFRGFSNILYGFGASKISGQYKVVRIIEKDDHCQVYTLGTWSWRRVEAAALASLDYGCCYPTAFHVFLNGNLHWLVWDTNRTSWISCFDLETECFSTFSVSPYLRGIDCTEKVFTLRGCLCLCDDRKPCGDETVDIWLMKEYGVEKSWTKEYVINFHPDFDLISSAGVRPIKVFKDGDILMVWGEQSLFYYSYKMKTTQYIYFDGVYGYIQSLLLTPSFLSLKSFPKENVISL